MIQMGTPGRQKSANSPLRKSVWGYRPLQMPAAGMIPWH